ncbi:MAG: isocitrate/isopropylmalate family dehydrogenase, partial [Fluviibacter sp.]
MSRKILVLPGDGIGPEITAEAVRVLEALNKNGLGLEISTGLLGGCAVDATGDPYPAETRSKAEAADAVLQGVCTTDGANAAMKLGVNYPAGPFDWLARMGRTRVVSVLHALDACYRG